MKSDIHVKFYDYGIALISIIISIIAIINIDKIIGDKMITPLYIMIISLISFDGVRGIIHFIYHLTPRNGKNKITHTIDLIIYSLPNVYLRSGFLYHYILFVIWVGLAIFMYRIPYPIKTMYIELMIITIVNWVVRVYVAEKITFLRKLKEMERLDRRDARVAEKKH